MALLGARRNHISWSHYTETRRSLRSIRRNREVSRSSKTQRFRNGRLLDGFETTDVEPWHISPPMESPNASSPPELRIEQVSTLSALREFEEASLKGFEIPDSATSAPFQIHAEASIEDLKLRCYMGRVDGAVVSVSMAYVSDEIVGVYGVATLPEYRRRGYAQALTRAAVQSGLGLPALLQPSPMAESMYERMGFYEIGRLQMWRLPGS